MPRLGLGTWKSDKDMAGQAVEYAILEAGYRHVDCAAIYRNEAEIGRSFAKIFASGQVRREDVFVTSKLWNANHASDKVASACQKTLRDLQLDYLDLYLMHWGIAESTISALSGLVGGTTLRTPKIPIRETWEAMEDLVSRGLVKEIGVANFTGPMLVDLLTYAKVWPAVNQIELHPYLQQTNLVTFCQNQGIVVTAYSPLGTPGNLQKTNQQILLQDVVINKIATAHSKSAAQILIRWAMQRDTVVIPKSTSPSRIAENAAVFDFELSAEEMKEIAGLERQHRFVDLYDWTGIPYF